MSKPLPGGMPPLVTVVLPVFNAVSRHPHYLPLAIESVLNQSYTHFELIIVDDGSTDDYAPLRERYDDPRISWQRQKNAGQSAARNLGARNGRGRFLAFLDQDDCWYPGWLEAAAAAAAQADFVYCDVDRMDAQNDLIQPAFFVTTRRGRHPKTGLADVIGADCFVMPSATLMDRTTFLALGGFDESLAGCEDDDLFRRFFLAARCQFLPTPFVRWRTTGGSASFSPRMDESRLRYFRILAAEHPGKPVRHWVAPRFLLLFSGIYRQAAAARDTARLALARQGLHELRPYLAPVSAMGLSLFLALPVGFFAVWQHAALNSRIYGRLTRMIGRR
jgi:glycosyltransferase involved in cell wall biosynthesis